MGKYINNFKTFESTSIPRYTKEDSIEYQAKKKVSIKIDGSDNIYIGDKIIFDKSQTLLRRIFPKSYIFGEPHTDFRKGEIYQLSNIWMDYKLRNNDALLTILTDFDEDLALEFTSDNGKKVVFSLEDFRKLNEKGFFRKY